MTRFATILLCGASCGAGPRVAVRGETYPGSKGTDIGIEDLVVFR